MYCVHESSTIQEPMIYRYTSNQRHFDTEDKKYCKIRLGLKAKYPDVQRKEYLFPQCQTRSANLSNFEEYFAVHAVASQHLALYYVYQTNIDPIKQNWLFRKLKLFLYIRRQKADQKLVNKIKSKFDSDVTLVFGDWSASHVNFKNLFEALA
ncbi:hypothetical protein BDF19DRAFT_481597 [Syncephalis fuscata]|nr:hypothetical protein BDF19DRAFT_481597 [Syncephalis fuscata]